MSLRIPTPTFMLRTSVKLLMNQGGVPLVMEYFNKDDVKKHYSKRDGSKFASAKDEIDAFIKRIPELEPARKEMVLWCMQCRKKVGLPT